MTWRAPREIYDYEKARLRDEVDHYRTQQQEQYEREQRAREERRRERQMEAEEQLRSAFDWYEAIQRQAYLLSREARTLDDGDTYFASGADACRRGLVIWKEEEAERKEQIEELERQLAELREGIRQAVSQRLMSESEDDGWRSVAGGLVEFDDPSEWLNW